MLYLYFLLYTALMYIASINGVEGDFCTDNPDVYYCDSTDIDKTSGECGTNVEVIEASLTAEEHNETEDTINEYRRQFANGKFSKGITFGDVIEIKYSPDAARVAQVMAKNCDIKNTGTQKDKMLPSLEESYVDGFIQIKTGTSEISTTVQEFLEKVLTAEKTKLSEYLNSGRKYDSLRNPMHILNKYRLFGCGRMYYKNDVEHAIRMICLFVSGDMRLSTIFDAKGIAPCTGCPSKTECGEDVLCVYNRSPEEMMSRTVLLFTLVAYVIQKWINN